MSEYEQEMETLRRVELAERSVCRILFRDTVLFVSKFCGNSFTVELLTEYKQLYESKERFEKPKGE